MALFTLSYACFWLLKSQCSWLHVLQIRLIFAELYTKTLWIKMLHDTGKRLCRIWLKLSKSGEHTRSHKHGQSLTRENINKVRDSKLTKWASVSFACFYKIVLHKLQIIHSIDNSKSKISDLPSASGLNIPRAFRVLQKLQRIYWKLRCWRTYNDTNQNNETIFCRSLQTR